MFLLQGIEAIFVLDLQLPYVHETTHFLSIVFRAIS